jgi:twitching motility protein PilT
MSVDKEKRFSTMEEVECGARTLLVIHQAQCRASTHSWGWARRCSTSLAVGVPPMLRTNGDLVPIGSANWQPAELEAYVTEILTRNLSDRFRAGHDVDFSYVSEEGGRFRVNVFRKDSGVGAVFRTIPAEVPTLDSLALPPLVKKLCDYHQGMILVTGSTGTGKSTTLAA